MCVTFQKNVSTSLEQVDDKQSTEQATQPTDQSSSATPISVLAENEGKDNNETSSQSEQTLQTPKKGSDDQPNKNVSFKPSSETSSESSTLKSSTPILESSTHHSEVSTPTRESVSEDHEGFDGLPREDLIKMLHKREKIALRYKSRFTEVHNCFNYAVER